tara:strand:- start:86 stop:349 length:264 start_codon:yes stop_codon:yes gene_type:complete
MTDIKLIEVEDEAVSDVPQGMKRVQVHVYWRWEDDNTYDIPKDMELSEVRDHIVYNVDDYFATYSSWLSEFEVWLVEDQESGEEWEL